MLLETKALYYDETIVKHYCIKFKYIVYRVYRVHLKLFIFWMQTYDVAEGPSQTKLYLM